MLHFRDRLPSAVAVLVGALDVELLDAARRCAKRGAQLNAIAVLSRVKAAPRLPVRPSPWFRRTTMSRGARERAQH